jgi:TonB-dependent receptor
MRRTILLKKCVLPVLLLFVVSFSLHALTTNAGGVSGNVTDSTGAVLPGAQIVLQPGAITLATDGAGNFHILDVAPGTYTLSASYVGFAVSTKTVTVVAGQTAEVNPVLTVSASSQKVIVRPDQGADAMALSEQRTSANILNVMTAPTIMSLPNENVSDALGRLPGVTLQRNEGEGQYVQIRGTEPRLSNTTIDGVIVPGPDPQVRQVDLDTIPADLVGAVVINKTLSASQDGDAIGGSVDLRIKQATSDRPKFSVEGMVGNTPIANNRQTFTIASYAGVRFGKHNSETNQKRYGLMLGYSYDYNGRGIDDVEPVPDLNPDGSTTFDSIAIQEYLYDRTRYGFAGSLDYQLGRDSDLYVHGLFSNFRDYGQKFGYIPTGPIGSGGSSYHTSVRRPNLQIADLAIGGSQVFDHAYAHYQVAFAHSRFGGAAGNPGADFSTAAGSDCGYSAAATVSKYRPQFPCDNPNNPVTDPTQYFLQDINLTSGQATQLNLQANGAFGIEYHLGPHASTFEFGGLVRNEHKGQDAYSPTYDNGATPPMSQFLSSYRNPKYYGGSYYLPPVTNFDLITNYLAQNPALLPIDAAATHLASDASNYNLQERISAGYIMNTLELGTRIRLQTGLRIEGTQLSTTGYLVINDINGNYVSTTPQHGSNSYVNPMPSVQFRYLIDGDSDIRAVYGRGISRPDPYQLVPYVTLDESTNPNTVGIGNPALVAEHANDFDLLYEKFLPSVGMVEAGYFYKELTKPIYLQQGIVPNPFPNPITPTVYQQQEVNGDHAHVQGVELAYQQHLTFLPGVFSGARFNANYTYTESRNYNLLNRTDTPSLVGQAPVSWNITPSYATKRALVTVGISHNGANIYAYQYQSTGPAAVPYGVKGPFGDNYFYAHTQVDAQASYSIGKGFTVLASGLNMNNAVFGFYNGSTQYMTQREYYKPTYSGGLRWTPHRFAQ